MFEKQTIKKRLFELLEECNDQLGKYKELRDKGLAKDEVFERIVSARKQIVSDILDLVSK